MIKKVVLAFIIGAFVTVFLIQDDQWVKDAAGRQFQAIFEKALDCSITFKVKSVNLFVPRLVLESVVVKPRDGSTAWSWKSDQYAITISWLNFITQGSFDLRLAFENFKAESQLSEGVLAIKPHFDKILGETQTDARMFIKAVAFKKSSFHVDDLQAGTSINFSWHSESKRMADAFKSNITFTDGAVVVRGMPWFEQLEGPIQIDVLRSANDYQLFFKSNMRLQLSRLPGNAGLCFITGTWKYNDGLFTVSNADNSLVVHPISAKRIDKKLLISSDAQFPLAHVVSLFGNNDTVSVSGACKAHNGFTVDLQQYGFDLDGQVTLENIHVGSMLVSPLTTLTIAKKNDEWQGALAINRGADEMFAGSWQWYNKEGGGIFDVSNSSTIVIPGVRYWQINPGELSVALVIEKLPLLVGSYHFKATNTKSEKTAQIAGTIQANAQTVTTTGSFNEKRYDLHLDLSPHFLLKKFALKDEKSVEQVYIAGNADDNTRLEGFVEYPFMRAILANTLGYNVPGEGRFMFAGALQEHGLAATLHLEKGAIRVPQTYNFMSGFDGKIVLDLQARQIRFEDFSAAFHRGMVSSKQATLGFDDAYHLSYMHLPIVIDKWLLNVEKDLFAVISASALVTKELNNAPMIKAELIVERSQLKKNILSQEVQKTLLEFAGRPFDVPGGDIKCDIHLVSKDPILVKTPFLETAARVNVTVSNTVAQPKIAGSIEFNSGALLFPYKQLNITKGAVFFFPDQGYGSNIELIAKNKIKKYTVTLHATGSLQDPQIIFESSPPLSEEQIIALLLVGNQESLQAAVPAIIMQNIKSMVFNPEQSSVRSDWLKHLEQIHLVPSFSDQSGRGGLRGALEIDSERWRAKIQKNFSLSEDTRFEIEYLLSDDVSLRGFRDEHRDVGGEVELRWKF